MRPDYALPMRAAILKAMKASADLTALIPKASIYPSTVPADATWPFSRIGSVIASPYRADGLDSASFRVLIQGFIKNADANLAEMGAYQIGSAFKTCLDGAVLPLAGGGSIKIEWERTIPLVSQDEASSWSVTGTFEVEVTPP